ncbi:DsbA family protein [Sneathiella aquimaris]|uniref:DsbA family protein n=1 Tax=Sneathiella aquimaris TaxID=2599305 RepID=UPI00146E603A|nr:DsbA family protein [Sneathiella aquimaris]
MQNSKGTVALISVLCLGLAAMVGLNLYQMQKPEEDTKDIFGAQVRAYLLENPAVIREAIQVLSATEAAEARQKAKEQLASRLNELENDGYSFVAGNPDGDITIVEFFDYQCGYCKRSYPDLMKTVEEDGNIRLVMKEFPILGDESVLAARAVMAAEKQGKYNEFHKVLMESRGGLSLDKIMSYAQGLGLNVQQLAKDMGSDTISKSLSQTYELAQALNITGTPAFVIGGQLAPGAIPADTMKRLVAEARSKKSSATN